MFEIHLPQKNLLLHILYFILDITEEDQTVYLFDKHNQTQV